MTEIDDFKRVVEFIKKRFEYKHVLYNYEGLIAEITFFDDKLDDRFDVTIKLLPPNIWNIIVYKKRLIGHKIEYEKEGYIEFSPEETMARIENIYIEFKVKKL